MEGPMKKVSRQQMRAIQKKALKDAKRQKIPQPWSSTLVSCDDGMIMVVNHQMDHLLKTDAFTYLDLEMHKHVRIPKIRRISHKVR